MVTGDAQRIVRKYWRTGITSQVRKLTYDYAFSKLGIDEIRASAWKDNTNSCRSIKAGFVLLRQREGLFSKYEKVMTENLYTLRKRTGSIKKVNFRERKLWCDKKSHSHRVASATRLDAKSISIRNCGLGNGLVGCMRKCGNRESVHDSEYR